jgi:hypothetical protein
MKTFLIAIFTALLLVPNMLFASGEVPVSVAGSATIQGKVVDMQTGEALVGVAVVVTGSGRRVYTDMDGHFRISGISPGTYSLVVSMISYKNSLVEGLKLEAGEKETISLKLDGLK